jgi:pyrroloquinoline quinone (PQQ) biosynthesis protein C
MSKAEWISGGNMPTPNEVDKYRTHPRLRENVWHMHPAEKNALLITSQARFEVSAQEVFDFIKMRPYCNGHHSVEDIAERSALPLEQVQAIVDSLDEMEVLYRPVYPDGEVPIEEVRAKFLTICQIWAEELVASYIGNEFARGELPKEALIGWLLEMYHYIKDFPYAIEHAANHATGKLKKVLSRYANEEKNHDIFVLKTLENLGLSRAEIESSTPMLSTRMVGFLMRELFEIEPSSVLMMAALVEAEECNEDTIGEFIQQLVDCYHIDPSAFDPYFEHQKIDVELGHVELLAKNIDLVQLTDLKRLDLITNKLHDLKHAFDLQGVEIRAYYTRIEGKYIPRQPVHFTSI